MDQKIEETARAVQIAVEKALEKDAKEIAKKISYLTGNTTLSSLGFTRDTAENIFGAGALLQGGHSIGTITWKATVDTARGTKYARGYVL